MLTMHCFLEISSTNNGCGYFRDQVNDGCSSGNLPWKTDSGFFPLSLYLLAISKKYEDLPQGGYNYSQIIP
jgi:hypothetical protein